MFICRVSHHVCIFAEEVSYSITREISRDPALHIAFVVYCFHYMSMRNEGRRLDRASDISGFEAVLTVQGSVIQSVDYQELFSITTALNRDFLLHTAPHLLLLPIIDNILESGYAPSHRVVRTLHACTRRGRIVFCS